MQDMFKETELWANYIITTNTTGPTICAAVAKVQDATTGAITTPGITAIQQNNIDTWDKKVLQALGHVCCCIKAAPMTHVACCTHPSQAWSALCRVYKALGAAAMTLLHNKFTRMCMSKGDSLEDHIKNIQGVYDELNIALMGKGSNQISELEFIRQLLASLQNPGKTLFQFLIKPLVPTIPKALSYPLIYNPDFLRNITVAKHNQANPHTTPKTVIPIEAVNHMLQITL